MGVLDGQPVNQAITNPAFINKNQDDTMPNKLTFSRALSGATIADIQQAVNNIYLASGVSESTTGTAYTAPAQTINVGDNYQLALSKLARKFDPATGHKHTGASGDAPPISAGDISGAPLLQFIVTGSTITPVTGGSTDVSILMAGKTGSTGPTVVGVVTTPPYNRVFLAYGSGANGTDEVVDSSGNIVYGRLTKSGGVWTVTYYTLVAGIENPYSFPTAVDLAWFYRELFNPLLTTPHYEPIFELWYKGVKTLAASGGTPLFGDVRIAGTGGGVSVTQSGNTILIAAGSNLSSDTPQDVGSANAPGSATGASRADHVHRGVHSLAVTGNSPLYGDAILIAGTGVQLSQVGQNITIAASGSGGGSGVGGVNYVTNFNGTDTTGWATYADGSATPTDGTGGSPSATWTSSSSNPLRGTANFLFTAGALGNGVAYAFTADRADVKGGAVITVAFDYEPVSGTLNTGDYTVWIYDITNAVLIPLAPMQVGGALGVSGEYVGTFQLPTNSSSFRLLIHQAVASPVNLKVDQVVVGPNAKVLGAAVTDWTQYTNSITGTTSNPTKATSADVDRAYWRGIGDSDEVRYDYFDADGSGAANGSGTYLFSMPPGHVIDLTKVYSAPGSASGVVGSANFNNGGADVHGVVVVYDSTHLALLLSNDTNAPAYVSSGFGNIAQTNAAYSFIAIVPIVGRSSNVEVSSQTDTRVVAARATLTNNTAVTGGNVIPYDVSVFDTHGGLTLGGSFKYTIQVPGKYKISATGQTTTSTQVSSYVDKNGTNIGYICQNFAVSNSISSGALIADLVAGDQISIRPDSGITFNGSNLTTTFNIERLSGPAQIAASEFVGARYQTAAGQSISSGVVTIVNFDTKVFDTHNAVTTGASWKFTAPTSGTYRVSVRGMYDSGSAWAAGNQNSAYVYKNGGVDMGDLRPIQRTASFFSAASVTGSVRLLAGEYVDGRIYQDSGGARSLYADGSFNDISIERIGNY